ncbi:U32 family peptidase [Mollicutes bacterium LVI A0039]|nr:U32 family peptidase [Mollicutes bacterium LVI A0039]
MKRGQMEILSPVKNLQAAKVVIGAGADAIYFASPSFGARTKASIEVEEAKQIISYAQKNNVATYAAFNTVIFDDELEQFFHEIDELYQVGLDAVIVQDYSFINLLKQYYPELHVHASTQMHIHNSSGALLIKAEGSDRVVVPREMNFERIKTLKDNTNLEIEAFVHGALCVSYSGQCYDSTLLDQKSANRGRCSQYCRMPQHTVYGPTEKIVSSGEYPLNLKDQNNLENLDKYQEAGVDSLKIEGRLKALDYAYQTTKAYRNKLDSNISTDLTEVYNREFTDGRINGTNGRALVNLYRPNNNGTRIGEVVKVEINKAKSLQYYPYAISIKLDKGVQLNNLDNIRFVAEDFEDGQIVEQFKMVTDNTVLVFSKVKPEVEDTVYRTLNSSILAEAKQAASQTNRTQVALNLFFKNGILFYALKNGKPVNTGIKFEKAQNKPTTKMEIFEKLAKTKNTPFDLVIEDFKYNDDLFCQISKINKMKQQIIEQLTIESDIVKFSNQVDLPENQLPKTQTDQEAYIEVQTLDQYEVVKDTLKDAKVLIANNKLASNITPDQDDYYVTPSVIYDDEADYIYSICEKFENIVASEMGVFSKFKDSKNVMTNYTLNTTNYINQQKIINDGAKHTILSIELNEDKLSKFGNDHSVVNIYGRLPVMMMDYCPINMQKTDTCGSCTKCHSGEYELEDKLGRIFPLVYAGNNRIAMLSRKPISLLARREDLSEFGIKNFHIRFTIEDRHDTLEVLENYLDQTNDLSFEINSGSYFKETL